MGVYLQNQSGINRICRHRYRKREENGAAGNRMLNGLWAGMMLAAVVYGALHGTMPQVTQAAIDSSKEAVMLCITMLGILSFWMGLMQVGSASGLIGRMTRGIRPALRCLFPGIPEEHPALEQIAVNCIANVLGLGWAATPAGLKAMEELSALEKPSTDPPRFNIAASKLSRVLVLGS